MVPPILQSDGKFGGTSTVAPGLGGLHRTLPAPSGKGEPDTRHTSADDRVPILESESVHDLPSRQETTRCRGNCPSRRPVAPSAGSVRPSIRKGAFSRHGSSRDIGPRYA